MGEELHNVELTGEERKQLAEFSSQLYGFINLNSEESAKKKALIEKAICYYANLIRVQTHLTSKESKEKDNEKEKDRTEYGIEKDAGQDQKDEENGKGKKAKEDTEMMKDGSKEVKTSKEGETDRLKKFKPLHNRIYCRLGNLHLLLEQFPHALSAYQKYFTVEKNCWKDLSFLYGLGLVYFHFNNFRWMVCQHLGDSSTLHHIGRALHRMIPDRCLKSPHIIPMHRSVKLFCQLLYQNRAFQRANEVHLRLGLMYKVLKNYEGSLKHFKLCLTDASECTLTYPERRLHIAHLYEVQGKAKAAKESYEAFLLLDSLQATLKATALRHLGWLYHTSPQLGDKVEREQRAIHNLTKSVDLDPSNGQTWYMLGRCYSKLNKVHDAFVSYRQSIDKSEANADTWCSIGVLYQQQNQPMDALQAYICAVQLDKTHSAAWTDLAVLYETCNQPSDALACYLNATRNKDEISANIAAKIKFLQQNINNIPMQNLHSKPRQLPSIEEAWRLPIPAELTSRQNSAPGATAQQNGMSNSMSGLASQQTAAQDDQASEKKKGRKRPAKETGEMAAPPPPPPPPPPQQPAGPPPLAPTQMQLLQYLLSNKDQLNEQQRQLLQQLQQQLLLSQQHQQQQQQRPQGGPVPASQAPHVSMGHFSQAMGPPADVSGSRAGLSASQPHTDPHSSFPVPPGAAARLGHYPSHIPPTSAPSLSAATFPRLSPGVGAPDRSYMRPFVSEEEMRAYYIKQESLVTEDLKQQMRLPHSLSSLTARTTASSHGLAGPGPAKQLRHSAPTSSATSSDCASLHSSSAVGTATGQHSSSQVSPAQPVKTGSSSSSAVGKTAAAETSPSLPFVYQKDDLKLVINLRSTVAPLTPTETPSTTSSAISTATTTTTASNAASTSVQTVAEDVPAKQGKSPKMTDNMTAEEIISSVKGKGNKSTISLLGDSTPPLQPPSPPPPLPKEQLNPPTPSVYLESKKDAFSAELQQYCHTQPVVVIRGIATALKLDLGLFSTKTLVEANPDHEVEVRTQKQQSPDENLDKNGQRRWYCYSNRSKSSVSKYAQYQATSFQESLKEEQEKTKGIHRPEKESDSDSNSSQTKKKGKKMIRFGTNVDLSDTEKWRPQLAELTKLPAFTRVVSGANTLSHVGHKILGMNTVQLYMKVPGSRTPGHQENNNFCSVNINIGPGDCEWFAVPDAYWGVIAGLCEKNSVDYLKGSWWPVLEDLYEHNVPVYRFVQKPGDLVWIGPGTVHWVQAIGWCNNIAWNVGPMIYHQYKLAIERYEYNKMQYYKSIVPMVHLSWNLARSLRCTEQMLYNQIKFVCRRSLMQQQQTLDLCEEKSKTLVHQERMQYEETYYCELCEEEVFNILFVKRNKEDSFFVYCQACALKSSPDLSEYGVLYQWDLTELMATYDNFQMYQQQPTHPFYMS